MILSILPTRFPASSFLALCVISFAFVVSLAGATALTAQTGWFGGFFGGSAPTASPLTPAGNMNDGAHTNGGSATAPVATLPDTADAAQNTATATPGTPDAVTEQQSPDRELFGPTYEPTADMMPVKPAPPLAPWVPAFFFPSTEPSAPPAAPPSPAATTTNVASAPLSCYICQYEPLSECEGKAKGDACKNTVTRNGYKECVWAGGRCVGYFEADCKKKVAASTFDWKITATDFPTATTYPSTCTKRNYEFDGHSSSARCRAFFRNITLCIQGADALKGTPVAFNFLNNGCSTFGNEDAVYREIERIHDRLPPDVSLTVTGNQVSVGDELINIDGTRGDAVCQTHWTLQLQRDAPIRSTFGACTPGAFCFSDDAGLTATCSLNGTNREQTCCTEDPYAPTPSATWTIGAACPVPDCRMFQTCNTPARSMSCSRNGTTIDQVCCVSDPFAASAALPDPHMSWTFDTLCPVPDCRTNQRCGRLSMPVSCMQNNRVTRQQCCVNDAGEGVWTDGPVCNTSFYGTCTGTSTALFSSDAATIALRDAYICLGARAARCQEFSYPSPCRQSIMSNGIFSRTVTYICPFVCSPRLPNL